MPLVKIGNPGLGSVRYSYWISKYEVTNREYVEFLNSVAKMSDPNKLYDPQMDATPYGGIQRIYDPLSKSFSYRVKPNMNEKPVNFVTWCSAARFANWLHNDRPRGRQVSSTTENGAYKLLPGCRSYTWTSRNQNAKWALPSRAEIDKAAYYNPITRKFSIYATQSNTMPTPLETDSFGNAIDAQSNSINFERYANWNGVISGGNVMTVGSGGSSNTSFYGTFDQQGNVAEWSEDLKVFDIYRAFMIMNGSFGAHNRGSVHDLQIDIGPSGNEESGGELGGGLFRGADVGIRLVALDPEEVKDSDYATGDDDWMITTSGLEADATEARFVQRKIAHSLAKEIQE